MNTATPFQYTGQENDGTGLYYYRARYYNPVWGRFISSDPIGFGGGMNTYAYVGGDPVNFTDPTGKASWITVLIGGGVGAVVNGLNYYSQGCSFWKGAENGLVGGLIVGASPNEQGFAAGAAVTDYLNQRQGVLTVPDPNSTVHTPSEQSYAWAMGNSLLFGKLGLWINPELGALFSVGTGSGLAALTNMGGAIAGAPPPCGCR